MEHVKESGLMECDCGAATGELCVWSGSINKTLMIEYMPEDIRASHHAAHNHGVYPHNGAMRLRVERTCAKRLREDSCADCCIWSEVLP